MRIRALAIVASVVGLTAAHLCGFVGQAEAASGSQGYAVYRDGVAANLTWHAAIMDDPHWNSTSYPVIQAPGTGNVVYDTWNSFLAGNTYQGRYRPKSAPSSTQRDQFLATAHRIVTERIPYSLAYQVWYNTTTSGTYVSTDEIQGIRCDGVVEYVYEWHSFRVYGSNSLWDVTVNSSSARLHHSGTAVTPKSQARTYLTKIADSLP